MSKTVIKVENLSKQYRLGQVGTGTLSHDLNRWWHRVRGKEDPYLKIGETNDRSSKGQSEYVWALKDINFEVQEGEVLGIIGKNGAGKSTLLKILSKVTGPTTGAIKSKGRIASLLEVGTGFHPELTGRENIYLNGTILGMTKAEVKAKLDEIVAFAGVERYLDTPVKRYSSGMMVRLGFAVAAHLEPEILIVDEVLAVGDAEFQKKAIGKMQDVSQGEGRTVLFVSHNMASVQNLCSKTIVLNNGYLDFAGDVNKGIQFYISTTGSSTTSEHKWSRQEAPGDERARLLSAKAYPSRGDVFNFESGITFEFIVESKISNQLLDVSFDLRNEQNILLFHHGNHVCAKNELNAGKSYTIQVKIPPFMLNEGFYYLDVWLGVGATEIVGNKNVRVIGFEVLSSTIDHISKSLPGILRPKIEYKIDK